MEFESFSSFLDFIMSYNEMSLFMVFIVVIAILLVFIAFLFFALSDRKADFENEKSAMLKETKFLSKNEIVLAMNKLLSITKTSDPNFEFTRGTLIPSLEKNISQIFDGKSSQIFSDLYDLKEKYSDCDIMPNKAIFFQRQVKEIFDLINEGVLLINDKSIKKINDFFEHKEKRKDLILKLERLNKELEEEINKKEKSE